MLTPKLDKLIKELQVLPSVGQKSAQRMALQLLTKKRTQGLSLAAALETAMHDIKECLQCHSFSDDEICPICLDHRRDDGLLCVVESASDVMAIEQSGAYRGKYFVLGGHLSPIDGINANDLHIDQLIHRIRHEAIHEVILATGATVEGQTTAFFIHDAICAHVPKITRLAQGIPMGGELEYVDSITLHQALQNRSNIS
ncbi:recombination mediator RecR [Moraxella catarrhalis]|uniref:recombination mediator RecR n=1 Tax=Moraxella catarrhalis TaxID=480 RepID=UPI0007E3B280|nr:recombination mediator RecR [Moraxella catarrhalis]MPW63780.1 recombination protein RecR [Moraxella catarrhalis]OAV15358.1 Recombination protein RecR [Moraxella catarrhalis]OAV20767.1 Recombination protein RecR [Moraxella catarrhalis]OBX44762.1 recombination protein RecR [Moraxella catarrhalis]